MRVLVYNNIKHGITIYITVNNYFVNKYLNNFIVIVNYYKLYYICLKIKIYCWYSLIPSWIIKNDLYFTILLIIMGQ